MMLTVAYRTLTEEVPLGTQTRLGVRDETDPTKLNVSLDDFYNLERVIRERLCWIDTPDSEIPDGDHQRRQTTIENVCDAVMDVFPTHWDESQTVAIDATGIHAWGRSMPSSVFDVLDELDLSGSDKAAKHARLRAELAARSADPDDALRLFLDSRREWEARWGVKTAKSGRNESFFGYHEHTAVLATLDTLTLAPSAL